MASVTTYVLLAVIGVLLLGLVALQTRFGAAPLPQLRGPLRCPPCDVTEAPALVLTKAANSAPCVCETCAACPAVSCPAAPTCAPGAANGPPRAAPNGALDRGALVGSRGVAGDQKCDVGTIPFPPFVVTVAAAPAFRIFTHNPNDDQFVSKSLSTPNYFEKNFHEWMSRALAGQDEGQLILDAGANIGLHTLYLGNLGHRVHAFEPFPRNMDLLRCSAQANGAATSRRITLNQFALGASESAFCMDVNNINQGAAWIEQKTEGCKQQVAVRTLDDYWQTVLNEEQPFLFKFDVEGFEHFLVDGAREMFRKKPPHYLFMEFQYSALANQDKRDPLDLLRFLLEVGYEITDFRGGKVTADNVSRMQGAMTDIRCKHKDWKPGSDW